MIPTEDAEQMAFVEWLNLKGLKHFHPPQETWTKSIKQKMRNKMMGVVPGVLDLFIVIPNKSESINDYDVIRNSTAMVLDIFEYRVVAIEMKRAKGGVVSEAQKSWIETLNAAGIESVVCRGAEEAIAFIEARL
jgi:hypothetical protein